MSRDLTKDQDQHQSQEQNVMLSEQAPEEEGTRQEVVYTEVKNEDGTISKKKTIRTITTKRVLSSSSSSSSSAHAAVSAESRTTSSSSVKTASSSSSSTASHSSIEAHASSSEKHATIGASTSRHASHTQEGSESAESTASGSFTTEEKETKKSIKSSVQASVFGESLGDHPFYKFLSKFPLKTLPAPHVRPAFEKATLYAYGPGWRPAAGSAPAKDNSTTVQSFDVDSFKWMTYLKFNHIDFDVRYVFEPTMSPSGTLPFLALKDGSLLTTDQLPAYVEKHSQSKNKLDIHQAAEAVAFIALAETKIHKALMYTLWFSPLHYHLTTRPNYFGHYNPFLQPILSYLRKSDLINNMLLKQSQVDQELIFDEASEAIESFAATLGDSKSYFFGQSEPAAVDVILFSYLHIILSMPQPSSAASLGADKAPASLVDLDRASELRRIVSKYPNLVAYTKRIWKQWFGVDSHE